MTIATPLCSLPDEPAPFEAPRCLGCDHRAADPRIGYLCGSCERRIPALLDRIRDRYARLDATPHGSGAGLDGSSGGAGTFESKPAARVDVLALAYAPARLLAGDLAGDVDEREPAPAAVAPPTSPPTSPSTSPSPGRASAPDTRRAHTRGIEHAGAGAGDARPDLVPTVVALGRVADRARAEGLLPPLAGPRTVAGEALRLSAAEVVVDLPSRWWVGWALDELRRADAALAAALDEVEPTVPLGPCPRTVLPARALDADGQLVARVPAACGGQVRSRDGGQSAACTGCGYRWVGAASVQALAGRAGDAHLDAAAIAGYLDGLGYGEQPVERIRKWAQLDGWPRRRAGRRVLYRLGDALASARARRGLPAMAPTIAAAAAS